MISPYTVFVDSHVHLDIVFTEHPERIAWLQQVNCLPVSWAFARDIETATDIKNYLQVQAQTIQQINTCGLPCFYLAGIHPRNITPDLRPEDVRDIIIPYLDEHLCLGIGEVGLETVTNQATEILCAQLDMVRDVTQRGKVFGLHTPRKNKLSITEEILSLLEKFCIYQSSIVIDHCTAETIDKVLQQGFWAGLTLSPIKTSINHLDSIVKKHAGYMNRMMLNTDSGEMFYEDLHDYYLNTSDYPINIKTKLVKKNALTFYGIK